MASIRDKLAQKKSKLAAPRVVEEDHPANVNIMQDGAFFHVDVDLIQPNPNQPRKYFDEVSLQELSDSIKQTGIIQPIVIRKDNDNNVILVAGERRLRASKMAELPQIPCILTKGNPVEISLIENLQRENLNPIEESEALSRMVDEYKYTQNDLAHVIGKGRSTIAETLSLNRLPQNIKDECRRADSYSRRVLVEVAKQKDHVEMLNLFSQIKKGKLTSDDVRSITRKKKHQKQHASILDQVSKKAMRFIRHVEKAVATEKDEEAVLLLIETLNSVKRVVDTAIDTLEQQQT
ncbi:MAG: ParB/RepB/Spo0J family partition protein [Candidatus Magnetomorum sp.]|nr:ParB/RepB/Spo0J family partition protein [Candidatus Magnetomorum sp.]